MADRDLDADVLPDWTPEDEELVRRAFSTLRADVDNVPLADVRFVKARGTGRRRRRALAWTAGAAAAVVVAGAVGFSALGDRGPGESLPAGPTQTSPVLADVRGTLPVGQEWAGALRLPAPVSTSPLKEFDSVDCYPTFPGQPTRAEGVAGQGVSLQGTQAVFTTASDAAGAAGAQTIVDGLLDCPNAPFASLEQVSPATGTDTWPKVVAYTAETGDIGWWVVAQHGRDVSYLAVTGTGTVDSPTVEQAAVVELARVAQQRLERYGVDGTEPVTPSGTTTETAGSSASGPTGTTPPASGETGIVKAIDQDMPVAGTQPLLDSALFVAGAQWASEALTRGYATEAGEGDFEGSAAVASCDADTASDGRFGIVKVRDRDGFIGTQRVRLLADAAAARAYADQVGSALSAGCTGTDGYATTVSVATTDSADGRMLKLQTTFAGGDAAPLVEYVGITTLGSDDTAVSTIVITDGPAETEAGFGELSRLMALAVQK